MSTRHFLTLLDLSSEELEQLIQRAIELKRMRREGESYEPMKNRVLGMIFEKSSTRTRVSFEAGMAQLGRGEPIEDSARVLSSMVDVVMIRTFAHENVERFAKYSSAPVINALTDDYHPCQLLADVQTYVEHRGSIRGKTVAWIGDGNNMCHSYMNAALRFGFHLNIATPEGYEPKAEMVAQTASNITLMHDPVAAAQDADLIVTDVWASMGQEEESDTRNDVFQNYQVNTALMSHAKKDALFMHCLRAEEVAAEVIDGDQSVVWDEAENRLHAQKALLEFLLQ